MGNQGKPAPGTSTSTISMRPDFRLLALPGSSVSEVAMNNVRRSGPPNMHAYGTPSGLNRAEIWPPRSTLITSPVPGLATQMPPSSSRQIPSGVASPKSAQVRASFNKPSSPIVNAVKRDANVSATINIFGQRLADRRFSATGNAADNYDARGAMPAIVRRVHVSLVSPAT